MLDNLKKQLEDLKNDQKHFKTHTNGMIEQLNTTKADKQELLALDNAMNNKLEDVVR